MACAGAPSLQSRAQRGRYYGVQISVGSLMASFLVSTIGFGVYLYGKRERRIPQSIGGLALMVFPYFSGDPAVTFAIGAVICGATWFASRAGW